MRLDRSYPTAGPAPGRCRRCARHGGKWARPPPPRGKIARPPNHKRAICFGQAYLLLLNAVAILAHARRDMACLSVGASSLGPAVAFRTPLLGQVLSVPPWPEASAFSRRKAKIIVRLVQDPRLRAHWQALARNSTELIARLASSRLPIDMKQKDMASCLIKCTQIKWLLHLNLWGSSCYACSAASMCQTSI